MGLSGSCAIGLFNMDKKMAAKRVLLCFEGINTQTATLGERDRLGRGAARPTPHFPSVNG